MKPIGIASADNSYLIIARTVGRKESRRMRDCENCTHYVVTDEKQNYEQSGCGTYTQQIMGCGKWDCEFEPRKENK